MTSFLLIDLNKAPAALSFRFFQHIVRFRAGTIFLPAKTGKDNNNKKAVIKTDHTNNGNWCIDIPGVLILKIVVIKLIAPKIEEIPDKCKLKIAKSTAADEWLWMLLNGG